MCNEVSKSSGSSQQNCKSESSEKSGGGGSGQSVDFGSILSSCLKALPQLGGMIGGGGSSTPPPAQNCPPPPQDCPPPPPECGPPAGPNCPPPSCNICLPSGSDDGFGCGQGASCNSQSHCPPQPCRHDDKMNWAMAA